VFFDLRGEDLVMGLRQLDEEGRELTLDQMDDVVTVESWSNEMSRVEELRFGDGLAIDISRFATFKSGYNSDDSFSGTAQSDLLAGGAGNDTLVGGDGDDILVGGEGNDIISGDNGNDDIYGGAGDDTLRGGAGNDYVVGGDGNDVIEGGAGDDVLIGGKGNDTLRGGQGNDTYIFNRGDGHDTIDESVFSVTEAGVTTTEFGTDDFAIEVQTFSTGGKSPSFYDQNVWISESRTGAVIAALEGGDDVLQFGNQITISDLIVSTIGVGEKADLVVELSPLLDGAEISDSVTILNWGTPEFRLETFRFANGFVLDVSSIGYAATVEEGKTSLNTHAVTLASGHGAWLVGGATNDTLIGSANNDILVGGEGTDRLEGGLGNDFYVYSRGSGKDVILDTGSTVVGNDPRNLGGDKLLFDVGITIEDLILQRDANSMRIYVANHKDMTVKLSDIDDVITIESWALEGNRIELLQFFNGLDFDISKITNTYLGGDLLGAASSSPVNDTLAGSHFADWMDGFAGDDTLHGNGGDDFIFGRDGNDRLFGGDGNDILSGGNGNDELLGGAGNDMLVGGDGDDVLTGDDGNDVLMGGTGNDTLNGGAGDDILIGAKGDDIIIASAGNDQIRFGFGEGNDRYIGNAAFANTDFLVFEQDVRPDRIWFERIDNSLILRLHGAADTFTFENWFYGQNPSAHLQGFSAAGKWLGYDKVNDLVSAMQPHISNMNDGTTAYGIKLGETPESVQNAIESAWV
jgi:Ca2+-binding RTX toxin-like protein